MKTHPPLLWGSACCAAAAVVLVTLLVRQSGWRIGADGSANGETPDVLALVFGEARQAVSLSLFDRADLYFHNGVVGLVDDADGGAANSHMAQEAGATEGQEEVDADGDTHDAHASHDHHDAHASCQPPTIQHIDDHAPAWQPAAWDLWSKLNARIHPAEHVHRSGVVNDREILPWLWAAARLDAHNELAFQVGAYWLAKRMGTPDEATRFLNEGIRNNPNSADLEFCRGEIFLQAKVPDYKTAHAAFTAALRKWQPGQTEKEKADRDFQKIRILMYLGQTSEKRQLFAEARQHYETVLRLYAEHPAAKERLSQLPPVPAP
jgi:tetratricopeptide (TPR) repeat protein